MTQHFILYPPSRLAATIKSFVGTVLGIKLLRVGSYRAAKENCNSVVT